MHSLRSMFSHVFIEVRGILAAQNGKVLYIEHVPGSVFSDQSKQLFIA